MNRYVVISLQSKTKKTVDSLTELGCVELVDRQLTGNTFSSYTYWERLDTAALEDLGGPDVFSDPEHCWFDDTIDEFLQFTSGASLIFDQAKRDIQEINTEIVRLNRAPIDSPPYQSVDNMIGITYPDSVPHILHVAERFGIEIPTGSIVDCARLLAEVYLALTDYDNYCDRGPDPGWRRVSI